MHKINLTIRVDPIHSSPRRHSPLELQRPAVLEEGRAAQRREADLHVDVVDEPPVEDEVGRAEEADLGVRAGADGGQDWKKGNWKENSTRFEKNKKVTRQ